MFTFWFHRIQQLCDVNITLLWRRSGCSSAGGVAAQSTAGVVIAAVSDAAANADRNASGNISICSLQYVNVNVTVGFQRQTTSRSRHLVSSLVTRYIYLYNLTFNNLITSNV